MVVDGLDLTGSLERDGDGRREEEEDGDFFSTVLSMEIGRAGTCSQSGSCVFGAKALA